MAAVPSDAQSDPKPPLAPRLLALAPLRLAHRRETRYQGDDQCVPISSFTEADQRILRELYAMLTRLLYAIADEKTNDAQKWTAVEEWIALHNLDYIFADVRALGRDQAVAAKNEKLAKATHDVRGGALNALLGRLQLHERLPHDEAQLKMLFVLARDHLKIMRNAVLGLDDIRRTADMRRKSHDITLIIEKWHDSIVGAKWEERPVRMTVDCRYVGALTECCLESAAIDRIFYNLANNASRHCAGEFMEMAIFPIPDQRGNCVRFVLSNEVGEEDASYLGAYARREAGADSVDKGSGISLLRLFEPAISSTGSGFGLTVVADFVAGAFGLRDRTEALRERYVGAVLEGSTFTVWFHWPAGDSKLPVKTDDFHHPQASLSEPA